MNAPWTRFRDKHQKPTLQPAVLEVISEPKTSNESFRSRTDVNASGASVAGRAEALLMYLHVASCCSWTALTKGLQCKTLLPDCCLPVNCLRSDVGCSRLWPLSYFCLAIGLTSISDMDRTGMDGTGLIPRYVVDHGESCLFKQRLWNMWLSAHICILHYSGIKYCTSSHEISIKLHKLLQNSTDGPIFIRRCRGCHRAAPKR